MSDRTPQPPGQDDAPLAPDLAWVERLLLAEGRRWRATEPTTERLARHVGALARTNRAAQLAETSPTDTHTTDAHKARRFFSKGLREPMDNPTTTTRSRWRAAAGAVAAVIVVGALATTFTVLRGQQKSGPGAQGTTTTTTNVPTPTPEPANPTNFFKQGVPVVAASQPTTVYRVVNNAPERSTDGGHTYAPIPQPTTDINQIGNEWIAVSPLDPAHIFVTIVGQKNGYGCAVDPNAFPGGGALGDTGAGPIVADVTLSAEPYCGEQFYSANAGQSWAQLNLASGFVFGGHTTLNSLGWPYQAPAYTFQAQGARLYGLEGLLGAGSPPLTGPGGFARLVTSADGGATWNTIDSSLYSAGNVVCDFAASPTGTTIYAVTAYNNGCLTFTPTLKLWRSDNAGQSWTQVSALASTVEDGMYVSASGALYIFNPGGTKTNSLQQTPQYALVSQDGGKSFTAAPSAGITGKLLGPAAILSDGAVVYATPNGLYSWKVGDASWRKIATPALSGAIGSVTVTPNANGGDTLTITTLSGAAPVTVTVQG